MNRLIEWSLFPVFPDDSVLKKIYFTNPVGEVMNMNRKKTTKTFSTFRISLSRGLKVKIGKFNPCLPHG